MRRKWGLSQESPHRVDYLGWLFVHDSVTCFRHALDFQVLHVLVEPVQIPLQKRAVLLVPDDQRRQPDRALQR
jgi:hypothetical protein